MKKTDIHVHTPSNSPQELLAFLREKEAEKALLMSSGEEQNRINREMAGNYPAFSWCCNIEAGEPEEVYAKLALCKEQGAVGMGELCINRWLEDSLLQAVFDACEKLELPVTIHMSPRPGYQYGVCDRPGLPMLEKVLQEHPHLKILGHSQVFWIEMSKDAPADEDGRYGRGQGKVTEKGRLWQLFRKYPNLYGDLSAGSGYCAITRDEENGLAFLETFQDQLLFGTDTADRNSQWQAPLSEWLEEKYSRGKISREVMEKICFRNAEKLYGIHHPEEKTVHLMTPCGEIVGIRRKGYHIFKGIRYATAKRWRYPETVEHWEGCYDGTVYGNCSFQSRAFRLEALNADPFYYHEFREGEHFSYSDDCLFLNIWTPEKACKAPVMVYIHGGAFLGGCGHEKPMHPEAWTRKGAVAVTLNYRLGAFGFLSFQEAEEEAGHTGNYGLYDQRAALEWIHRNIASFGGDPDNVTLIGQSAGAMSVNWQCAGLESEKLFAKAAMFSGGGTGFQEERVPCTGADAKRFGEQLKQYLNCGTLEELRSRSASQIISGTFACMRLAGRGLEVISPLPDSMVYPCGIQDSLDRGSIRRIPYLLCSTSEDLWKEGLVDAGRRWGMRLAQLGEKKVYQARLSRQLPGDDKGAWHSADLWYWFGSLKRCWRPFEAWDAQLSEYMVQYLCSFAAEGVPGAEGLPVWQPVAESGGMLLELGDKEIFMNKGE